MWSKKWESSTDTDGDIKCWEAFPPWCVTAAVFIRSPTFQALIYLAHPPLQLIQARSSSRRLRRWGRRSLLIRRLSAVQNKETKSGCKSHSVAWDSAAAGSLSCGLLSTHLWAKQNPLTIERFTSKECGTRATRGWQPGLAAAITCCLVKS